MQHEFAKAVCATPSDELAFSIGTLVTRPDEYNDMTASFRAAGFGLDDCEFLYIDNSGTNQCGAFAGLNALLNRARGRHIILCHQDVRPFDDRRVLETCLRDLDTRDPAWAIAGNAGGTGPGKLAIRITDPHGRNRHVGALPARVHSLDENFLIIRRDARIGLSHDLEGFHFYGADLCLMADIMGRSAYVIDYHLEHLSPGRKDLSFEDMQIAFREKWSRALRPRWVQTTCSLVRLTGNQIDRVIGRFTERPFAKIARRLPGASGWRRGA